MYVVAVSLERRDRVEGRLRAPARYFRAMLRLTDSPLLITTVNDDLMFSSGFSSVSTCVPGLSGIL